MAFSDVAGDGLFYFEVRQQASTGKVWVSQMIMPYTVFFALSLAVSSFSMLVKLRLLFAKLRSRMEHDAAASQRSLDSVDDPVQHVISKLKNKKMVRICLYCHIATAMIEDLPMGAPSARPAVHNCWRARDSVFCAFTFLGVMNIVYLLRSILEARCHACARTHPLCRRVWFSQCVAKPVSDDLRVCDLQPNTATVVLIASVITSAAMLGYKAARTCALMGPSSIVCLEWFHVRVEGSGWCLQRSK
jgi:hypothetical protein